MLIQKSLSFELEVFSIANWSSIQNKQVASVYSREIFGRKICWRSFFRLTKKWTSSKLSEDSLKICVGEFCNIHSGNFI